MLLVAIALPLWTHDSADIKEPEPTLQPVITVESKPKEIKTGKNYYQGVLITRAGLISYLETVFTQEGIEDQIPRAIEVIQCESGFQVDPKHNGISWGVAQFTPPTWEDFGEGDIMNPHAQLRVMARMWRKGLQNRWDCYSGRR